jgi:hypothetical protein
MNRPRTALVITGVVLFITGACTALLYSQSRINQSIDKLVEQKMTDYAASELAVREHLKLNNEITELKSLLASLQQANSGSDNLSRMLLESYNELKQELASIQTQDADMVATTQTGTQFSQYSTAAEQMEKVLAESTLEYEEHYTNLENNFQSGDADPQWTSNLGTQLEATIEEIRSQTGSDASVLSMDCKTNMCRVEVSFNDNGEASNYMELALMQNVGNEVGESSSRQNKDDSGRVISTVYYLAKKGHSVVSGNAYDDSQSILP